MDDRVRKAYRSGRRLMGQILRFVNSSYFGFSREIASIPQAIQLVGARTIKNFALWSAVFSLVPNPKFGPFDLKSLWQDSLRRAVFARELGRSLKLTNAEICSRRLCSKIWRFHFCSKHYPNITNLSSNEELRSACDYHASKRNYLDGTMLKLPPPCAELELPEEFSVLIERHPNVEELLDGNPRQRDAACVAVASLLPACKDADWDEQEEFEQAFDRIIGDRPVELDEMITKVDSSFAEFAPILQLAVPKQRSRLVEMRITTIDARLDLMIHPSRITICP